MYVCIYFQLKFLRNKSLLELGIFFFSSCLSSGGWLNVCV